MKYIKPTIIDGDMLISSTRAEDDYPAWSGATTYGLGSRVISAATHRIYESVQGTNTNHDPTTDTGVWWVDVGPTNRWAMFDSAIGTVTSSATPLAVEIEPGIIDSLALFDLAGTSVRVQMHDGVTPIYDTTYALPDTVLLENWYAYFFEEIIPTTMLIVTDLPPYGEATLTVTINAVEAAECGTLVVGKLTRIGTTLAMPTIGIIDYSRKETSEFGVTTVVERSYAKRIEARFYLDTRNVDFISRRLAEVRATPVVWIADDERRIEAMAAFGYYKDWGIDIAYPTFSTASITIEGMT